MPIRATINTEKMVFIAKDLEGHPLQNLILSNVDRYNSLREQEITMYQDELEGGCINYTADEWREYEEKRKMVTRGRREMIDYLIECEFLYEQVILRRIMTS